VEVGCEILGVPGGGQVDAEAGGRVFCRLDPDCIANQDVLIFGKRWQQIEGAAELPGDDLVCSPRVVAEQ
jgi:hypothetical protein